jgi:hypothetical protein
VVAECALGDGAEWTWVAADMGPVAAGHTAGCLSTRALDAAKMPVEQAVAGVYGLA